MVGNAQRRQSVIQKGHFRRKAGLGWTRIIRQLAAITAILIKIMDQALNLCGAVREGEPGNHPQVEWVNLKSYSSPNKTDLLYFVPNKPLNQSKSILIESINVSQFSLA